MHVPDYVLWAHLLQELDSKVGSLPIQVIDDGLLLFRRGRNITISVDTGIAL
jgi:hypothetical protein